MEQRRKVTIILLIGLTLFLGVGSILVTQIIRTNQSPTDSAASGFGAGATKDLYDDVTNSFANADCSAFLTIDQVTDASTLGITKVEALKYVSEDKLPLICYFGFGSDDKYAVLKLHSYSTDSYIDNSQEELFTRINGEMLNTIDSEAESQGVNYFFGQGRTEDISPICRTTFFHVQNDFEYAELTYYGFDDCEALKSSNDSISKYISNQISTSIIGVNANFIDEAIKLSDYKNIRQALQSVSCTYLLTERTDAEANAPELIYNENAYFKTRPNSGDQLKSCEYKFDENNSYKLNIRAVDLGEKTDPTEFKSNINSLFKSEPSTGNANSLEYNFGTSVDDENLCRAIVLLPNDEYTYLDVAYTASNCSDNTSSANVITNFTESTRKLIDSIAN